MNRKILVGLLCAVFCGGTSAATVFDFTGYESADDTLSLIVQSDDGLVSATLSVPGGNLGFNDVSGAGARGEGQRFRAIQDNETLQLAFSQPLTIAFMVMGQWEGVDSVTVTDSNGVTRVLSGDSCALCGAETFAVRFVDTGSLTLQGSSAATSAYLTSLTAVPLPAAGYLFAAALLGLSWSRAGQRKNLCSD